MVQDVKKKSHLKYMKRMQPLCSVINERGKRQMERGSAKERRTAIYPMRGFITLIPLNKSVTKIAGKKTGIFFFFKGLDLVKHLRL